MKQIIFITLSILLCSSVNMQSNNTAVAEKQNDYYHVNAPKWTTEKLDEYCLKNKIMPMAVHGDIGNLIYEDTIVSYLEKKFTEKCVWNQDLLGSNSVSSTYGGNPIETDENNSLIQLAKKDSTINKYDAVGCGPLSLITQLDFLSRYAGYSQFLTNPDSNDQRINLYKDIFNTIRTFPKNGEPALTLELMGFTFDKGTFTFPHDLISGTNQLLLDYNITNGIGAEDFNSDGTYKKMINVRGDVLPSFASINNKLNTLITSIDKGMPVILWTTNDAGQFKNHFMNIFGYEYWVGIDEHGNSKSHLFFKLRMNWNYRDVYMDSDVLNAFNCGLILFEEELPRVTMSPSSYHFPQSYNNSVLTKQLNFNGTLITTKRLRTGYINEDGFAGTGKRNITMSPKKKDAGEAFLEYNLYKPINFIYFDIRFWSSLESLNSSNGEAYLEYKDGAGNWSLAIDFLSSPQYSNGLSSNPDNPNKYRFDFPYGTRDFRFISYAANPTNTSTNKGRIVIGNLGIVFDTNNPNDSNLFVTMSSDNDSVSSAINTSGHSWTEIYNNSPHNTIIGKYVLPPFEAVTIGLWGNKTHKGVYYNLEYYNSLTEVVDSASSSISSSDSSSGSSGGSSGSSSSSMWSKNSFGLSSWLYKEYRKACIVSCLTGRVSLTETISPSLSSTISEVINHNNNEWRPRYNCSHLAIDIWNSISPRTIEKDWIQTPTNLMDKIKEFEEYQLNRNIFGNPDRVGYYTDDNVFHFSND